MDTTSAASAATVCRPMSCGLLRPQRCGSSVFVVARRGSRDAQARRADETLDPVGAEEGAPAGTVAPQAPENENRPRLRWEDDPRFADRFRRR